MKSPQSNPEPILQSLSSNDLTYTYNLLHTEAPIDFFKKIFLPNHLYWFLLEPCYIDKLAEAQHEKVSKSYFDNLLCSTLSLYKYEQKIKKQIGEFIKSPTENLRKSICNLLLGEYDTEVLRVAYNSQVKDFIREYIITFPITNDEKAILLMPSYGTVYSYLASQSYNNDLDTLAQKFFGSSLKDAESRTSSLTSAEYINDYLREQRELEAIRYKKEILFQKNKNLVFIDGLITFDKLIDKLIVYSGLLRHSVIAKYLLLKNTGLTAVEIFKIPTKELSNYI